MEDSRAPGHEILKEPIQMERPRTLGFVVIEKPTPVYRKDNRDSKWKTLGDFLSPPVFDAYGQIDPLATSLKAGNVVAILAKIRGGIFKIQIPGLEGVYYIDRRFIDESKITPVKPPEKEPHCPPRATIFQRLHDALGKLYVWGGTSAGGFPEILKFYPSTPPLSEEDERKKIGAGYDCSGLLHDATDGFTPRNSTQIAKCGQAVDIENLSVSQIIDKVEPLDTIVWTGKDAGHVMIILDKKRVIESKLIFHKNEYGEIVVEKSVVCVRSLQEVLKEIMGVTPEETVGQGASTTPDAAPKKSQKKRKPVNSINPKNQDREFVIRRWYSETNDPPKG